MKNKSIFLLIYFTLLIFSLNEIFAEDFSILDKHAYKTPKSIEKSIETLVQYLIKPAKNDTQKARVIFSWIAYHISYNTSDYFSGNHGNNSAEGTFQSRSSVCQGYSNLFKEMAEKAGLECVVINGYSKGYGYTPRKKFSGKSDHAWNAVKIDNKWMLIDSTWGAGIVNQNKKFVFKFKDYYFFTPPDQFVLTHFPMETQWQLMKKPITLKEFEKYVRPRPEFFQYGFTLTEKEAIINADKSFKISLNSKHDLLMLAKLKYNDKEYKNLRFIEKNNNLYNINMVFPYTGQYELILYAKNKNDEGTYPEIIKYFINVKTTDSNTGGFPITYPIYYNYDCILISPQEGTLIKNIKNTFQIKSEKILKIAIVEEGSSEWIFMVKKKDMFEKNFWPKKTGKVKIYAKFPNKDKYWTILEYQVIEKNK